MYITQKALVNQGFFLIIKSDEGISWGKSGDFSTQKTHIKSLSTDHYLNNQNAANPLP